MLKPLTALILTLTLVLAISITATAQDDGFVEADAHEHGAALITLAIEGNTLALDFISPSFNIVGFEYAPKTDEEKEAVNQALSNLADTASLMSFSNRASCSLVTSDIASEMSEGHEEHGDEHGDEHGEEHHEGEEEHHEGEDSHHDEHKDEEYEGKEHHDEEHHEGEDEHHDEEHKDEHHDEEHESEDEHHDEEHKDEHHDEEHESEDEHHDEEHEGEEHHEGEDDHHDEEHDEHGHDEHGHDEDGEVHSEFHASYEFSCSNMNRLSEIDFSGLFAQYPNVKDLDLQYVTEDTQGAVELNPEQTVLNF